VNTRNLVTHTLAVAAVFSAVGCQFRARTPEDYRDETRAVLESRSVQVKTCYDNALREDPTAKGTVAVHFKVERETGRVTDARVDKAKTTAPEGLSKCVLGALDGLLLQPPDARDGDAQFVWDFQVGAATAPPKI
jgi:hypothetical protein